MIFSIRMSATIACFHIKLQNRYWPRLGGKILKARQDSPFDNIEFWEIESITFRAYIACNILFLLCYWRIEIHIENLKCSIYNIIAMGFLWKFLFTLYSSKANKTLPHRSMGIRVPLQNVVPKFISHFRYIFLFTADVTCKIQNPHKHRHTHNAQTNDNKCDYIADHDKEDYLLPKFLFLVSGFIHCDFTSSLFR